MSLLPLDHDLHEAIRTLADAPTLLVASDVDGTLAPIVADPADAVPDPAALDALAVLATLPGTDVALVSGRRLRDLTAMTDLGPEVALVGSHGAEHGTHLVLSPELERLGRDLLEDLRAIVDGVPGTHLEEKAAGVAVHVRRAARGDAARVVEQVLSGPATRPGVRVTQGKEVVELSVVDADKGRALDRLRTDTGAGAVLYVGDDVTDEWAFARVSPPDVSVKVGPGETGARFRVGGPGDVTRLLQLLAGSRAAAVGTDGTAPGRPDSGRRVPD